jgi:hypothetical protein
MLLIYLIIISMLLIYLIIILQQNKNNVPEYMGGEKVVFHWNDLNLMEPISLFVLVKFRLAHKNFALYLMHVFTINGRKVLEAFIARLSAWSFESANILLAKRETCACIQFCKSRSEDCYNFIRNSLFSTCLKFCKINRGESMKI